MRSLVQGLMASLEPSVQTMVKMPWMTIEGVGDESPYVGAIRAELKAFIPTLRSLLSPVYFRNFCDKFASAFLPHFGRSLTKCKRIGDMGAQQRVWRAARRCICRRWQTAFCGVMRICCVYALSLLGATC